MMWRHLRALIAAGALVSCAVGGWLALKFQADNDSSVSDVHERAKQTAAASGQATSQLLLSKAEADRLALYDRMASELAVNGLNGSAIAAMHPWFHGVSAAAEAEAGQVALPWPRKYAEFDEPLPQHAVRLLVIPIDCSPSLAAAGAAITAAVLGVLPAGTKVFSNARTHYHCTLFHTSHPMDPRPAPSRPDGGVSDADQSPAQRRGPTSAELAAELIALERVVAAATPPTLRLHRVLLASSGTLLMTWLDSTGRVDELRGQLRSAFPGAPTKQASIIHTSLARIVSTAQLPADAVAAVQHICDQWTDKLRGRTFAPQTTWFVRESEFSTIVGEREVLAYRGNVPGAGCGKA